MFDVPKFGLMTVQWSVKQEKCERWIIGECSMFSTQEINMMRLHNIWKFIASVVDVHILLANDIKYQGKNYLNPDTTYLLSRLKL